MITPRRGFLKAVGAALAGLVLSSGLDAVAAEPSSQHPNILFILSDDHALQTIGAYDSRLSEFCRQQNVTPNIDRLAAEGALAPGTALQQLAMRSVA